MNKEISLNEQQADFLKSILETLTKDTFSQTTRMIALQIIAKLEE